MMVTLNSTPPVVSIDYCSGLDINLSEGYKEG
jgi:hypothetical protein